MVAAFGSLGRLEYVPGFSDLDCMVVVDGPLSDDLALAIRSGFLTPLAAKAPWIMFDHRSAVLGSRWQEITNVNIPFPVISIDQLLESDELDTQRRWQLVLEGRALFNDDLFSHVYQVALPTLDRSRDLMGEPELERRLLISGRLPNPLADCLDRSTTHNTSSSLHSSTLRPGSCGTSLSSGSSLTSYWVGTASNIGSRSIPDMCVLQRSQGSYGCFDLRANLTLKLHRT
jgi:hypothetical protein